MLLQHFSYFGLYDGSGNFLNNLPFEISASAQPRWSRTAPYVLYYVSGNQLKQYNVVTNAKSVVHTFAEYSSVTGKGKSDISFDGDHFVLVGDSDGECPTPQSYEFWHALKTLGTETELVVYEHEGHMFVEIGRASCRERV